MWKKEERDEREEKKKKKRGAVVGVTRDETKTKNPQGERGGSGKKKEGGEGEWKGNGK